MSDREDEFRRSPTRSRTRSRTRSYSKDRRSYSRSRSRDRKSRSRSPRRSYSRSRSRSYGRRGPYRRERSRSPMSSRRRHRGNRDDPEPNRCVGVFGLSLDTRERDLEDFFGRFGKIDQCQLVMDRYTHKSRGFAFIHFKDVEDAIEDYFSRYGRVKNCQLVLDRQTGRSRGFAFIHFEDIDDAIEAKEQGAGSEIDGKTIRVDYSVTERAHTPTPGVYLGRPTPRRGGGRYSGGGYGGGYGRRSPSPYRKSYYDRRSYDRRSPSPYYRRGRRSRTRSRSYSPRR